MRKVLVITLLLALVLGSQYMAWRHRSGVSVTTETLAGNPVTHYHAPGGSRHVVIVAHGFASNKEMMRPWGYYLATAGFETYVFDEPGHGASRRPLPAWQDAESDALGVNLTTLIDQLVLMKRAEPGQVALVGHSMGGAAVTQAALADGRIKAIVAISSAYGRPLPADKPANLLSLAAERDPASVVDAVTALATLSDNGRGALGKQYGDFSAGTARESDVIDGRNHITILYDAGAMARTAGWIARSLGAPEPARAPDYGWAWVGLGVAGALALVLALAAFLSPPEVRRAARNLPRVGFLTGLVMVAVAAFSAVLAAAYLRIPWPKLATTDYLLAYMLVMALVLLGLRLFWPREFGFPVAAEPDTDLGGLVRVTGIFLAFVGAAGTVVHMNAANFVPTAYRFFVMIPMALIFWLFFAQEEGLKRAIANDLGPWAGAVVGVAGKLVIVATWMGATALPNPLIFLPLTIPVVLPLFLVLEVFSYLLNLWRYPAGSAAAFSSLVLAWSLAVTMPLL
ncbi:MAG TPA: alpha/beta fold hydrolase [Symbiobacteriaceae bacterium]|nr:alpha/beta fold hydrolase [Symbiobacteriaceae bacterium]